MNILQGIKASNPKASTPAPTTKFIIKSKPSVKQNKPSEAESQDPTYASSQDVHQLIAYIVAKSKRLAELLESKGIEDVADFHHSSLFENACIRTYLKSVMDKMLGERRLGKGLKGINKGILTEIENIIWQSLEREVSLYQLDKVYEKQKSTLQKQLQERKQYIQQRIHQLNTEELESKLIMKQSQQNLQTPVQYL